MKKELAILFTTLSILFAGSAKAADYSFAEPSDFTGEAFFTPPVFQEQANAEKKSSGMKHTMPPVKKLRLMIKKKIKERNMKKYELAPTLEEQSDVYSAGTTTSEYASKEVTDNFDEMTPDGFEADEETISEIEKPKRHFFRKKAKEEPKDETEDIILDCNNVDYDTENYLITAKGDAIVDFVKQGTKLKADLITFDRMNNTIKAEGNVKILKGGQTITGDYIFVDMNEENALIENPLTRTEVIEIKSKKGYVYGDRVVQENGEISVDKSFPINFRSATRGPQMQRMLVPPKETLSEDMENGLIRVTVQDLKITQKGDLEIISMKHPKVFKGKRTIFKMPAVKLYTNKNHDFAETNSWELGSYRGLGMFVGPGWVFELPRGSVLKAAPILNYKSGFGVGGLVRFQNSTNFTQAAYGTAVGDFIIRGKQDLDDHLYLQYGMNDYMNEWFLGRRRPEYGVSLVYTNGYSSNDFLLKGHASRFSHRFDAGYYQDIDKDHNFRKLSGEQIGTTRFRYMAQADQNLYKYENKENQTALSFNVVSQLSAALYGTGDSQVIGRLGPHLHTQYKRWMQDIGYFFSVYDDNTPMPVFDAYRYGKQNLYIREYFRICRYLTVSWFGSINLTGDSPNDKTFQENSFYLSIGPDDLKFNVGYDFIRENTYFTVQVMMDAKGTKLEYDTFEIKQDKKAKKNDDSDLEEETAFQAAPQKKVLQRAVVEDIKVMEDVL